MYWLCWPFTFCQRYQGLLLHLLLQLFLDPLVSYGTRGGGQWRGLKAMWVLQVTAMALRERVPEQLAGLLTASHPELRAAAVFTLGTLVQVLVFQIIANNTMSLCFFQPVEWIRVIMGSILMYPAHTEPPHVCKLSLLCSLRAVYHSVCSF